MFIRANDNALWHNSQLTASGPEWSGWTSLGGILTSNPAVVQSGDGRLEVFVRGNDSALWHIAQTAPSAATWNAWSSLGGILTGDVAGSPQCRRVARGILCAAATMPSGTNHS